MKSPIHTTKLTQKPFGDGHGLIQNIGLLGNGEPCSIRSLRVKRQAGPPDRPKGQEFMVPVDVQLVVRSPGLDSGSPVAVGESPTILRNSSPLLTQGAQFRSRGLL